MIQQQISLSAAGFCGTNRAWRMARSHAFDASNIPLAAKFVDGTMGKPLGNHKSFIWVNYNISLT